MMAHMARIQTILFDSIDDIESIDYNSIEDIKISA